MTDRLPYEWIDAIRTAKNRKDKVKLIKEAASNRQFERLMRLNFDPNLRLGFKIPPGEFRRNIEPVIGDTPEAEAKAIEMTDEKFKLLTGTNSRSDKVALVRGMCSGVEAQLARDLTDICNKKLRLGIGDKAVTEAMGGIFKIFGGLMLAAPFDETKVKFPVFVELKLDGVRVIARPDESGYYTFYSRDNKPLPALAPFSSRCRILAEQFVEPPVFDGEFTLGKTFKESVSAAKRRAPIDKGTFSIFDVIDADFEDRQSGEPLCDRKSSLRRAFKAVKHKLHTGSGEVKVELVRTMIANSLGEIDAMYRRTQEEGFEGLIIKNVKGEYAQKRSIDWMKMKNRETLDLEVIGAIEGEGQFSGSLGKLIVDFRGVEVRIGGGFTPAERDIYWQRHRESRLNGMIIEVSFQEITPDGSLRHPNFVAERSDRSSASF